MSSRHSPIIKFYYDIICMTYVIRLKFHMILVDIDFMENVLYVIYVLPLSGIRCYDRVKY